MPDILTFKTKEEVPEGLRSHAVEKDGVVTVKVVAEPEHAAFRTNNIALLKERDELKNKLTPYVEVFGEDVTKVSGELTELRTIKQQVDDGTLKGTKAVADAVEARVASEKAGWAAAKTALEASAAAANQKAQVADQKFKGLLLDQSVASQVLASDSGFAESALADIQSRARGAWKVQDDGTPVLLDAKGTQIYSVKEPGTPMPMKEWLEGLAKSAQHFLKPSVGGGAHGGNGTGNFGMSQEAYSKLKPSERMELARKAQAAQR